MSGGGMRRCDGSRGNSTPAGLKILLAVLAFSLAIAGCVKDCREAVRMGDFEYSQRNYENAIKHYEHALRDDPKCYDVEAKIKEARNRAAGR